MYEMLKEHCRDNEAKRRMMEENTKNFCYQIIHEMLVDDEFAANVLPNIDQNKFQYSNIRTVIGVMKEYYSKTKKVPSSDEIKTICAEKSSDEIDRKILEDTVSHCLAIKLTDKRRDEIHASWNIVYVMFHYVSLLNRIYSYAMDTESIFLEQYSNIKRLAKTVEEWRTKFYADACVQEILGRPVNDETVEDEWVSVCGGTDSQSVGTDLKSVGGTDSESHKK